MAAAHSSQIDVLIIGAGIGGLALAHALLQRGKSVRVLETAPALENVGAGIQIPPNAVKVLRALGLENAVMEYAFHPRAIEARMGRSGRRVLYSARGRGRKTLGGALPTYSPRGLYCGFI